MKFKRPSFLMLAAIALLVIVLHNKLHSETNVAHEVTEDNSKTIWPYKSNEELPPLFLRLSE